jgi:hypothetical protein
MTMTSEFVQRSRERLAVTRALLLELRKTSAETFAKIEKISRQQTADGKRLGDRLGKLAEDVPGKLPDDASDADMNLAYELKDEIEGMAGTVEEVHLGGFVEDVQRALRELLDEDALKPLKSIGEQLTQLEQLGAKLGI